MSICLKWVGVEHICTLPANHSGPCGQWPAKIGSVSDSSEAERGLERAGALSAEEKLLHLTDAAAATTKDEISRANSGSE